MVVPHARVIASACDAWFDEPVDPAEDAVS